MKRIDKIKMLVGILEENIEILENYPSRVEAWKEKEKEHKEKYGDKAYYYYEPYPIQGTSQSHIRDIAKLLRKELLKL